MKKGPSALFLVLLTTLVLVSNVLAAPAQLNKNATLISTTYQRGGIVLLFQTTGFSKSDLKNISLTAHSKQWDISCNFVDDTTDVRCVVTKKLSMFHGKEFHGALAGFFFSGTVPSARTFTHPVVTGGPLNPDPTTACPDGQTLSYTFEYSNTSYEAEVWSNDPIDQDTFYSTYGVYPEYTSTNTDTYTENGVEHTEISYIYGYATTTSGHGSTPADNWDALVAAYEADGYSIQQTGEECNSSS
jgi:hypothetical protein